MDLWAVSLLRHHDTPPFANHQDLYNVIDSIPYGNIAWQSFTLQYNGEQPIVNAQPWMDSAYDVWFRDPQEIVKNMLKNPDFKEEFDFVPYRKFDGNDDRVFGDFMSGDWPWQQAVCFQSVFDGPS